MKRNKLQTYLYFLQNKCVRYWPDENQSKEVGKFVLKNISESSTTDYILREFLLMKEDCVSILNNILWF